MDADDGDMLTEWALLGQGIVLKPVFEVAEHLRGGRLVPVLPDFPPEPVSLAVVYPHRRLLPAKVKAFADFMVEEVAQVISPGHARAADYSVNHVIERSRQSRCTAILGVVIIPQLALLSIPRSYAMHGATDGCRCAVSAACPRLGEGVIGMQADRQEHRPQPSGIAVSTDWNMSRNGEPRLEELMEDPMMGLIWRRDGLEPVRARETLRELQAIVQAGRCRPPADDAAERRRSTQAAMRSGPMA